MSFDFFPEHEIFTGFKLEFKGTRVLQGELTPVTFTIRLEIAPSPDSEDQVNVVSTFHKIKYFVDEVLENSIFIDLMDEWSAMTFVDPDSGYPQCSNNLEMLPHPPTNMAIAEAITCKLNALCSNEMQIGFVQLSSSDRAGLSITSVGDPIVNFPSMTDWVGEPSYFSAPWWARDDASTMDIGLEEESGIKTPPEFAYSLAFLLDPPVEDEGAPPKVVRMEFKPKIIEGGKKD